MRQISLWRWGSIHSKQVPVKKQCAKTSLFYRPSMSWKFHWGRNDETVIQLLSNCYYSFKERWIWSWSRQVSSLQQFSFFCLKKIRQMVARSTFFIRLSTFVHAHQICYFYIHRTYIRLSAFVHAHQICYVYIHWTYDRTVIWEMKTFAIIPISQMLLTWKFIISIFVLSKLLKELKYWKCNF